MRIGLALTLSPAIIFRLCKGQLQQVKALDTLSYPNPITPPHIPPPTPYPYSYPMRAHIAHLHMHAWLHSQELIHTSPIDHYLRNPPPYGFGAGLEICPQDCCVLVGPGAAAFHFAGAAFGLPSRFRVRAAIHNNFRLIVSLCLHT